MLRKEKKGKRQKQPGRLSRFRDWLRRTDDDRPRTFARSAGWVVLAGMLVVGAVAGMRALEGRVLRKRYQGHRGRAFVRLARAPRWMPESLSREIVADITPPDADLADRGLAHKVYQRCCANPWVRNVGQVHVRPNAEGPGGVVEVLLDFRRPLARVRNDSKYYYVDAECHRLPACQVPGWVVSFEDRHGRVIRQISYLSRGEVPAAWRAAVRQIHYITLDGVTTCPPPPGWQWKAEDLAAGLRLVQLVRSKAYYPQITLIDVRNHGARISRNEPELRMYAQLGRGRPTDIRFGRFPAPGGGDYVVSPQRKVSYLDEYTDEHGGRLAGLNSYLDLRFDELHVSIN